MVDEINYSGASPSSIYGRTSEGKLVPILVDADGNLQQDIASSALPAGASTSALQTALNDLIGEVQASPTENTVLDRLKELYTTEQATLAALGGEIVRRSAEITRPENTTQYAAKDAIADASASAITHKIAEVARANGKGGMIVHAELHTDDVTPWTNSIYCVIYDKAAPSAFVADNSAFDLKYADVANIAGVIKFPSFEYATGAAGADIRSYVEGLDLTFECAGDADDIYFQLYIPSGTPTPISGQKFTLSLGIMQS